MRHRADAGGRFRARRPGHETAVKKRARAWVLWWLGCFGFWLILVADWSGVNAVAGACIAAVAATISERARAAARFEAPASWSTLRNAAHVPLAILVDFVVLSLALARSVVRREVVRGEYVTRAVDPGTKTTPAGGARRAWLALLSGYSPNAYLIDVDPDRRTALLHDLVPRRSSEKPA
jgi:multisubunit Na+/H+ antiporter MnhE subunit